MIAVSARQTPFSRVLGNFDQHRSFKDKEVVLMKNS